MVAIKPIFSYKHRTMAEAIQGQRHERSALILYGSETGNSQDVAEELGRMAERLHFVTRVSEMDLVEIVRPLVISHPPSPSTGIRSGLTDCIDPPFKIHGCHFRNLNHWSRRIPEECQEILEKSSAEAFASRLSTSREVHDSWSWRHLISKVWNYNS